MKLLPLLLLGGAAVALYYFWNPTICSALNRIPGLDKFDMCNLGHGGVIDAADLHNRTHVHTHQRAIANHQAHIDHPEHFKEVSRKVSHLVRPPSLAPASSTIGVPVGGAAAAAIGQQIASQANMAELSHSRMSI